MGLSIFAAKGTVEGRIDVVHRPAETRFVLTTAFFTVGPGAPPPFQGLPSEPQLMRATAGGPNKDSAKGEDPGCTFKATLETGNYQVCVLALPFVVEGKQMLLDPDKKSGHWPLARAIEIRKNEVVNLALRVEFPPGLGKYGDAIAQPFAVRIGPALAAVYRSATDLGKAGRIDEALQAYVRLAGSPEASALAPGDSAELRVVAATGTMKCLLLLGRPAEARGALVRLGDLQQLFQAVKAPVIRIDFVSVCASLFATLGLWDEVAEQGTLAIQMREYALGSSCPPTFPDWSLNAVRGIWSRAIAAAYQASLWNELRALGLAGQAAAAEGQGLTSISWLCIAAEIEVLVQTGDRATAMQFAQNARWSFRDAGVTPDATVKQSVRSAGLVAAASLLDG